MKPLNYVIFARVSSREQEREGHSLEGQVGELVKWAEKHEGKVLKIFKIAETATRSIERKTFHEMVAFVRKQRHEISAVLVYKLDRAARNMKDYIALETLEEELGINLIAITQETQTIPLAEWHAE